jgi:hypothetical protein
VFQNRVLRRICEPARKEVAEGWRRLHNEEICNLYASPDIIKSDLIKENEMGGGCNTV